MVSTGTCQKATTLLATPRSKALFEKLVVAQSSTFPYFVEPKIHYGVYNSRPTNPILSQLNAVEKLKTFLFKI